MTAPTPPIELAGTANHLRATRVEVPQATVARLETVCPVITDVAAVAEASRDWWPLAMHWALAGEVPMAAAVVCRPASSEQVAAVLAIANETSLPVTTAAGRSGVCGASVPIHGGVVLDMTGMAGVVDVVDDSLTAEVLPGTFGPDYEAALRGRGLTGGHFPQSIEISTVGGWLACRGAGQYSTRYGKVEDMVVGLEVVLADGTLVRTGGAPRAATGPDLTQLFVGSEGTLGVITRAWLRVRPAPVRERRAAWSFATFDDGLDACRRILRRGATPAVVRLYDGAEAARSHGGDGQRSYLLVLDEGDELIVDATMEVVAAECDATAGVAPLDAALVGEWLEHRNDTSALQALTHKGFVVDTMEIAAPWHTLPSIFDRVRTAMLAVPHARAATCHLSHAYLDGACLYFTFAATPPADEVGSTYRALWDEGTRATLAAGGNLSHHHGVGLNRSRFVAEALGSGLDVLASVKQALDPAGILNPGKLGLASPWGAATW